MPALPRRAYHESGHAVAAAQFGISIDRCSLHPSGHESASHFQRLSDYCRLQFDQPTDLVKLDQYVVFLLAGSVTEMLAVVRYHALVPRSKS